MFDWVPVNIIDMPAIIALVTNHMLPIAVLPQRTLPALQATLGHEIRPIQTVPDMLGDGAFYNPPARLIVTVAFRQCPDTMQMIRQHHPRVDGERVR